MPKVIHISLLAAAFSYQSTDYQTKQAGSSCTLAVFVRHVFITPQNGKGWERPLEIIQSSPFAKLSSPQEGHRWVQVDSECLQIWRLCHLSG